MQKFLEILGLINLIRLVHTSISIIFLLGERAIKTYITCFRTQLVSTLSLIREYVVICAAIVIEIREKKHKIYVVPQCTYI